MGICIARKTQSPTKPTNGLGFGPTLRAPRPAMGLSTDPIEPIWVHNRPPLLTQQYKYANLSQVYNLSIFSCFLLKVHSRREEPDINRKKGRLEDIHKNQIDFHKALLFYKRYLFLLGVYIVSSGTISVTTID